VSQNADRRVFISKNFDDSRREEVDACCILGRACQVSTLSLLALPVDKYKYGHLRRCVLGNGRHELGFKTRHSNARLTSRLALTVQADVC
jgi:hypothetical protein